MFSLWYWVRRFFTGRYFPPAGQVTGPTTVDSYLESDEDFVRVPAIGRFATVPLMDRWALVPVLGRFPAVPVLERWPSVPAIGRFPKVRHGVA